MVGSCGQSRARFLSLLSLVILIVHAHQAQAAQEELAETLRKEVRNVRDRAIEWLVDRRNSEFGWDLGDTPRVVLALSCSLLDWPAHHDLEARLTVKQLEVELLDKLLRHDAEPVTPAHVAYFSLALNGACKDARNFHGHNLIASLEKHTADQDYPGYPEEFGFSLTALVSCLSGSHLHRKQVRHLINIADSDKPIMDAIDTRSMAVMALECIRRRKLSDSLVRYIGQAMKKVALLQQPDGTFGNIHTTTMAIQALSLDSQVSGLDWNRTGAARALSTMQRPDGSFLDSTDATAEAIIAATSLLNGVGLLTLKRGRCSSFPQERPQSIWSQGWTSGALLQSPSKNNIKSPQLDTTTLSTVSYQPASAQTITTSTNSAANNKLEESESFSQGGNNNKNLVTVKYYIWIGPDPSTGQRFNLSLQVPGNTSFFVVMRRAAELDPNFEFSSTVWPNGHYIHTISGFREQPIGYHYWLLYHLLTDPDPSSPPPTTFVAPAGVDNLKVADGDIYLFWYKKL